MITELKSLMGYPICDEVARNNISGIAERVNALEEGTVQEITTYHDCGDIYDLLAPLEIQSMRKTGYRVQLTSPPRAQVYANHTIYYFDVSSLNYDEPLFVKQLTATWDGSFCAYDPADSSYTLLWVNGTRYLDLTLVPNGCYLCMSCTDGNYSAGGYKYFSCLYINPTYTPKFDGLDESITSKPIKLTHNATMEARDANKLYLPIDLSKFENCLVRISLTGESPPTMRAAYVDNLEDVPTIISTTFKNNQFIPWTYQAKYFVLIFTTTDYSVFENCDLTIGWINPEVAVKRKKQRYWGPKLFAHNSDTLNDLVSAIAFADAVDLDVCRTLDGHYVCIHGTSINGLDISTNNLEDLNLTNQQMEVDRALEILKKHEMSCFFDFRNTTAEQSAELCDHAYTVLGDAWVKGSIIIDTTNPLHGHAGKFHIWGVNNQNVDDYVSAGAKLEKITAKQTNPSTTYNKYDWNISAEVSSRAAIPTDGSVAWCFVNKTPLEVLNE